MRMEGRRPRARVVGVIAGALEISRIIASIFLTMSLCSVSAGSRMVGIAAPSLFLAGEFSWPGDA
jgi:hypothetical protein